MATATAPVTSAQGHSGIATQSQRSSLTTTERKKLLAIAVGATAEAMGTELSAEAIDIFVRDLLHLPDADIKRGLERCRREVKGSNGYAPKLILQDLLDRAGVVSEAGSEEMEAIAAWDTVTMIADKFLKVKVWVDGTNGEPVLRRIVGRPLADCPRCTGSGRYLKLDGETRWVVDCSCRPVEEVPQISDRIADVVRRMGGWVMFKGIQPKSFPFVRRDFMLEFGKWKKVENYRSMLPAGENLLALGQGDQLAIEHPLSGELDKILAAR